MVQGRARHQAEAVGDTTAWAADDEHARVEVVADELVGMRADEPGSTWTSGAASTTRWTAV